VTDDDDDDDDFDDILGVLCVFPEDGVLLHRNMSALLHSL
jgi:hypothetical protein